MKTYKYVEVADYNAALSMKMRSLDDFSRFLDQHQYRQLFLLLNEEQKVSHFAVTHQGALIYRDAEGYRSMEDYHEAFTAGYPTAISFYDSKAIGCKTYKAYTTAIESGATDMNTVRKIRDAGFIDGFAQFTEMKKYNDIAACIASGNAYQLYQWANAAGFASFDETKEAIQAGFTTASVYRLAIEKGFTNAKDYDEAQQGNFISAEEWKQAKEINARDRDDLNRYTELMMLGQPDLKHDELTLLVLLSKLPQNKKVSLNKLGDLFRQQIETYRCAGTGQMSAWYTSAFNDSYTLTHFLMKNEEARKFGAYDVDGEFFETRRLQERKIVIDGSNVAYNSQHKNGSKPSAKNIIRMVETLKEKGFTGITVMSDASLKHRIQDPGQLKELENMTSYIQTPAEQSADAFIIDYVKKHRCLLVSNDTFRDWKLADAWIAMNIDYYRLSFVIDDDTVLLPDVDNDK